MHDTKNQKTADSKIDEIINRRIKNLFISLLATATIKQIEEDDIVVCLCADRDISQTKNGSVALPAHGSHSLSDSIIVGILNK